MLKPFAAGLLSTIALLAGGAAHAQAAPPAAIAAPSDADRALKALYDEEWAWREKEFGRLAGDETGQELADYLPHVDVATQQKRRAYWESVKQRLDAIPAAQLSPEEQINAQIFRVVIENFIEDQRFRSWEMPFNSDSAFWSGLGPREGFRTVAQYERYIARLRQLPRYFDEHIVNMKAGLARGFSVPRVTLAGRDSALEAYVRADATANPLYTAFAKMPNSFAESDRARLRAEGEKAVREAVIPAYRKLLGFLRTDYMTKARPTLAAEAMPDGKAFYQAQIRQYTTLELTAAEIHTIGLKEVARIEAEMQTVMKSTGFTGDLKAFIAFLRSDPRFYAKTPDELLHKSAWIAKRVDGKIGQLFGTLPRHRFTILPVPADIAPYYTSGRGGLDSCMMNTYDLPSRPLYNLTALTLHECAPGHSFQAAVALEQPERPAFRRRLYFSGYGEGWGLYTEWLGVGMGVYDTPYDEFGRLGYEMWRAARLVIDTGVHHMGWSRDQALAYLRDRTALSEHEVTTEIDRYISWPGQALAYKLGEMTIRRLRREAEAKLGPAFDQKRFHDVILATGSVPLTVLEARIARFIANGGEPVAGKAQTAR